MNYFLLTIFIGSTLNSDNDILKMATKTYNKQKGHRVEKTRYHIPFYTKDFFEPEGANEEEGKAATKITTVKIPVRIDSEGEESRSNVTNCEIRAITHFDNNVENVLTSIAELKERVIKTQKTGKQKWNN